jgi:hypothetical protein
MTTGPTTHQSPVTNWPQSAGALKVQVMPYCVMDGISVACEEWFSKSKPAKQVNVLNVGAFIEVNS